MDRFVQMSSGKVKPKLHFHQQEGEGTFKKPGMGRVLSVSAYLMRESEIAGLQFAFHMSGVEHWFLGFYISKAFSVSPPSGHPFVSFGYRVDDLRALRLTGPAD